MTSQAASRPDSAASTAPRPDRNDFLAVDSALSDDERAIGETVRRYAQTELAPHIRDWYERGVIDPGIAPGLGQLGLLGMHLDGYGCAGTSAVAYGVACRELEAIDSGLRSFVSVQGSLAMYAIHRWGSEEQRLEWLPRMAQGEAIGCFGLTEADAGSDPSSMRTYARRDGEDWVVTGSKMWITNGELADVAVVWAQTDDGIRGFVVPTASTGFSAHPVRHKVSLRASVTSELVLDGVRLPRHAELPAARGLTGPLSCLNEARYGILWGAAGAAQACYEEALEYTTTRHQFGRPLAGFQLTQRKLADMLIAVNTCNLVAHQIGKLKDTTGVHPAHISFGKLANVRLALEVARTARGALGAAGITLDHGVMRHMANLESVVTYEGTEEMHTLTLGKYLTGSSAFR
ncbi:acyl-CoA dehydrogenase family protein [Mycolicibacterium sp. BiH015]|uniref:acyl-CoA dehydrogenase family protein n=1 Tax=Mycolicibacterium sp. BiH015 TaxID=3018808 RepID=UPI0022E8BE59|nr:acyl-CoA dehydrogenase family protein [Mycolicibacterium sp. BiH015]MDA2893266.1 acyl-CoA dehydrogenase family protein [Mycolicibacterium sp. BiH015]